MSCFNVGTRGSPGHGAHSTDQDPGVPQAGEGNWLALSWDMAELTQFTIVMKDGVGGQEPAPKKLEVCGARVQGGTLFCEKRVAE